MNDRIGISDAEPLHYKGVEEPRLPVIEQLLSDRPGRKKGEPSEKRREYIHVGSVIASLL